MSVTLAVPVSAPAGVVPAHAGTAMPAELTLYLRRAWMLPGLLLLVGAPALVGSLLIQPESYSLLWGQPLFFGVRPRVLAVCTWVAMFGTAVLVTSGMPQEVRVLVAPRTVQRLGTATRLVAAITIGSYAVWLAIGLSRGLTPAVIAEVVTGAGGAMYQVKQHYLAPVGGITTWMALGCLVGPLAVIRYRLGGGSFRQVTGLVVGLALVRSVLVSERLALLEVLIPTAVVLVMTSRRAARLASRPPVVIGGYVGAWLALYSVFAVLEYVRSWSNHYRAVYPGSFVQFAFERVLGYYATALNNAAMVGEPGGNPSPWLLLGGDFGSDIGLGFGDGSQLARGTYGQMLAALSNPEFNNLSGLLLAPTVLGAVGGAVLWALLVAGLGLAVRKAAAGSITWLVLYSVTVIGVLEVVRLFYFGQSRFVVVLLGVVLVGMVVGPSRPRNGSGRRRRPGGRRPASGRRLSSSSGALAR